MDVVPSVKHVAIAMADTLRQGNSSGRDHEAIAHEANDHEAPSACQSKAFVESQCRELSGTRARLPEPYREVGGSSNEVW